ncbi:DUF6344 domain-containing protein [Streptomyces sp. S.PB5]|uniref:DUF6344 domain-containing protein n=1 Tax=Streptomyces sp. S.PB5 TaxID=3020844 RepID=UPI0025B083A0|nr:DUF6344 domain-containing protein [Streptomyces sp. S.PB5]MDN3023694.1 DUF6344 domain-containing protein [Streptomyces sp. S.PB5]
MTQNKVMKLWTAVITAFLALCTALGLVTTTAAAAVPQTETTRNSTPEVTTPALPLWSWAFTRSLPPTMKQRIRAEAHGKTPSCRHRPPADEQSADEAAALRDAGATAATASASASEAEPVTHLQR